jgi:predicted small secreted protein
MDIERSGSKMKKIIFLVLILFSFTLLAGCNTMQGLGKDIQGAGEAIEEAAD